MWGLEAIKVLEFSFHATGFYINLYLRLGVQKLANRIAVLNFEYEGNSLSMKLDGVAYFSKKDITWGTPVLNKFGNKKIALSGGILTIKRAGYEPIPIMACKAGFGGYVKDRFYIDLRTKILNKIKSSLPLQGIYLALHGAMICQTISDPEGDLIRRIRQILGSSVPIAVSLDLHAHVTEEMVSNANIIVGYQTYPHQDAYETGVRATNLLIATLKGEIKPIMKLKKINAILPVFGGATTQGNPMETLFKKARLLEKRPEILSISYFPVQPWLDFEDVGISSICITDDSESTASKVAMEIVTALWELRYKFEVESYSVDDTVEIALDRTSNTTIIVDTADSIGGGASGDSPAILDSLLRKESRCPCLLSVVDPFAVEKASKIECGNEIKLKIGSFEDNRYFKPVEIGATIISFHDGTFVYSDGPAKGLEGQLGKSVVLRTNNLVILITSEASYENGADHYKACGLDFSKFKVVVFKNLMNFRTLLSENVTYVAAHGPGATPLRLQDQVWKNRKRPFWPLDDPEIPELIVS